MSRIIPNHNGTGFDAIEAGGEHRLLSLTPPKPRLMALPRALEAVPQIPESDWKPTNRIVTLGDRLPRYDQGQVGKCEPTTEVELIGGCRATAGLPPVRLSTGMAYALVNGGVDQGAGFGDVFAACQAKGIGVCLESTMPGGFYKPNQVTAAALAESKFVRPALAYHGSTFAEVATAILLDQWPGVGVYVGNNFNNLSAEGACPIVRARYANHAVSGIDLVQLKSGQWGILCLNHWGVWGMTGIYSGMFIVTRDCFEAVDNQDTVIYQGVTIDRDFDLPPAQAA